MRRAPSSSPPARRQAPGGRFLLIAALAMAFMLAAMALLVIFTEQLGRRPLAHQSLIDQQLATIEAGLPRTILVGDSTLDYAIDLPTWHALGGPPAANLALTGNFGYEGSYRMIERALAQGPLDTVVIMQTAGMLTRSNADLVAAALREPATPLAAFGLWWQQTMNFRVVSRSVKFVLRAMPGWLAGAGQEEPEMAEDAPPAGQYVVPPDSAGLSPAEINRDKLQHLEAIAELCAVEDLRCVYVHGPLGSPLCERSADYLERADALISATGLALALPSPLCIPPDQLGDAEDHIDRALAPDYTRRYLALLAPHLAAGRILSAP